MNSSRWKDTAEIIGIAAIVASLAFVGMELRQNTAAVQSSNLQSATDGSQEYLLLLASNPELSDLYDRAAADWDSLTAAEKRQVFYLQRAVWLRIQNAYIQWSGGTMSDEGWQVYRAICTPVDPDIDIAATIRTLTWDQHKGVLTDEFASYIEACWKGE